MEPVVCGPEENDENHCQKFQDSITQKIVNVVSGFTVGIKLDPVDIARRALNAEYNPQKLNAVVMRIKEPKTTALIFPSGKIIVTGARHEDDSKVACRKIARILQKLDYTPQFKGWTVLNMVGMLELPFAINLTFLEFCGGNIITGKWEPEIFPGFVGRILKPKMTVLVFSSGKVVVLGFKESKDLGTALHQIFPVLVKVKRSRN